MDDLEKTNRWIPVKSSWVEAVSYTDFLKKLEIKVKPRRKGEESTVYSFNNVPVEVFKAFLESPSKGDFFNRIIRPKYGVA